MLIFQAFLTTDSFSVQAFQIFQLRSHFKSFYKTHAVIIQSNVILSRFIRRLSTVFEIWWSRADGQWRKGKAARHLTTKAPSQSQTFFISGVTSNVSSSYWNSITDRTCSFAVPCCIKDAHTSSQTIQWSTRSFVYFSNQHVRWCETRHNLVIAMMLRKMFFLLAIN